MKRADPIREEAYGFAKTGQTICNVTDSKIINDEPFWLPNAHLLNTTGVST